MFIIYLLMLLSSTQEKGKVKGRIVYENGKGVPEHSVCLRKKSIASWDESDWCKSDSVGYFEMSAPPGEYTFTDYRAINIPVEVKPDSIFDLGTIGLDFRFMTHDEIAGKPNLKAKAYELERTIVTPHLEQKIEKGKNVLWCGTFQLAWNELCDVFGEPKPSSPVVDILNKRLASKADLDEGDYVAMAGGGADFVDKIFEELERKFSGQACPELLERYAGKDLIAYAYLFKHLPFKYVFERRYHKLDFQGKLVDCFAFPFSHHITHASEVAEQVHILDYKNNDDFIIELKTTVEDNRLILAKISPKRTLLETVKNVEKRIEKGETSKLRDDEHIQVPVFNFDILREYNELYSVSIGGINIDLALQSIRFRLDEAGAVLKSEVIVSLSAISGDLLERRFIFDKPFLILLKRKEAKNPYFALWVGNPELLVSTEQD